MDFLRRLIRPPLLWGTGVVISAAALLLLNLLFKSLLLAFLVVLTIALIVVIVVLARRLQAARAADEIERSITRQADRDIERSIPGRLHEMEDMKAQLLAAIEALKQSQGGQSALSTLPWYMVIGASQAGKSTLIARSALRFPLQDAAKHGRSVRGVGGTRGFEWWLSQEAVLLDMAGRSLGIAAQFEEDEDWVAFLDVLRKQRGKKPINGVLVTAALDKLADRSDADVERLATDVRERLRDLVKRLGVVFPVYVLFTKVDSLAGFTEYFSDLGAQDRDQPWGATLPAERSGAENAEQLFDAEFDQLAAVVSERRMRRLTDLPDEAQRASAFAFPLQVEHVRPAMRRFVGTLFEPDPTHEALLFRGFYLTSAVQEGVPRDRVLEPLARAAGVTHAPQSTPAPAPGAWFVHDLLTEVVFEDAGLAGASSQAEVQRRRRSLFTMAGAAVAFIALTLFFSILSCQNGRLINSTRDAAKNVTENLTSASFEQKLQLLEALRAPLAEMDAISVHQPLWRRLGAYSGDAVREPALRVYVRAALDALLSPAVQALPDTLRALAAAPPGRVAFIDLYDRFRTWRLLCEPKDHFSPEDTTCVSGVLHALNNLELSNITLDRRGATDNLLKRQVAFLAHHPDLIENLKPYDQGDQALVGQIAAMLRTGWDTSQLLDRLTEEVRPLTKELDLRGLLGHAPVRLSASVSVPGPFTLDGWNHEMRDALEHLAKVLDQDWVVSQVVFAGAPRHLSGEIYAAYAHRYSEHWVRFLSGLRFSDPVSVGEAALMLKRLDEDNDILNVMKKVKEQTTLGVDDASPLGAIRHDLAMVHAFFDAPITENEANGMRRFIGNVEGIAGRFLPWGGKGGGSAVTSKRSVMYVTYLKGASAQLEKLDPSQTFVQSIRVLQEGPVVDARARIEEWANQYRDAAGTDATRALLEMPLAGVAAGVGGQIGPQLNALWNDQIVKPFTALLARYYPFTGNPNDEDAKLGDFSAFFKPSGGIFWKFYDENLKDKVARDGTPIKGLSFSPAFLGCLRHASELTDALFPAGSDVPLVHFEVSSETPDAPDPRVNVSGMVLMVGGKLIPYINGPKVWKPAEWPGPDPSRGASLQIQTSGGGQLSGPSAPGEWGLFRLLDRGQISDAGSNARVIWSVRSEYGQISATYEIRPASSRHPFHHSFLTFGVPAELGQ